MNVDAWKYEVFGNIEKLGWDMQTPLSVGECGNYEACRAALMLHGVEARKIDGIGYQFFVGNVRVFVRYTRVRDGYQMVESGFATNQFSNRARDEFAT